MAVALAAEAIQAMRIFLWFMNDGTLRKHTK